MHSFVQYLEKIDPQYKQGKFIEEIAHSTPDIIYVLDLSERRIIFINDRVASILGYEADEVYKLGSLFFVRKLHPDDYLRRMQHIVACRDMKKGEERTIDVRLRVKNGSWRWFRIRDIAFKFQNHKVIQTIGVARDVHELKLAENEIREKEELLHTAINLIPDPFYAFKSVRNSHNQIIDFEWIILNDAAAMRAGDAIGKRLLKKFPGVRTSGLFETYKKVVETGQSITTEVFYDYDQIKRWARLFIAKMNDGFVVLSSDPGEKGKNNQSNPEITQAKSNNV